MLKNRLKKIEDKINKAQGKSHIKVWLINVRSAKSKKEAETMVEKMKKGIIARKIPHSDGSYFSEKDENIFVISAVSRPCSNRQN